MNGVRMFPDPRAETAPGIEPGVQAAYMLRVVLMPRIRNPKRPLPFGRVRSWDGDRVWVEWMGHGERIQPTRLISSVRAQFLRAACGYCRQPFAATGERHRHEVDGIVRVFNPAGVIPDAMVRPLIVRS